MVNLWKLNNKNNIKYMPDIASKPPYHKIPENIIKKQEYDKLYKEVNKKKCKLQSDFNYKYSRLERFKKNPEHYLWTVAKSRAKKYKIDFNIEPSDIIIPLSCPITNNILEKASGYSPNSISLDRVNNDLGYVKGNVRVISRWANLKKSSLKLSDLYKLIKYIKNEI